jgi:primosomal protein N'
VPKVKGEFRWAILLKGNKSSELHAILKGVLNKSGRIAGVSLSIDVDPK